jgi:hypothetical protein
MYSPIPRGKREGDRFHGLKFGAGLTCRRFVPILAVDLELSRNRRTEIGRKGEPRAAASGDDLPAVWTVDRKANP